MLVIKLGYAREVFYITAIDLHKESIKLCANKNYDKTKPDQDSSCKYNNKRMSKARRTEKGTGNKTVQSSLYGVWKESYTLLTGVTSATWSIISLLSTRPLRAF